MTTEIETPNAGPQNFEDIKLFKVEDVASMLNVHSNTVRRLIKTGELPYIKIGNVFRFTAEQIEFFLNKYTHKPSNNKKDK